MDYHILIDGKPKCEYSIKTTLVTCGHKDIQAAEQGANILRDLMPGSKVIIQEGRCPESVAYP